MKLFRKFFYYFKDNKRAFINYSILSFFVAMLELWGVVLVYPFVYRILSGDNLGSHGSAIVGLFIIAIFIGKNIFMMYYTYLQTKFIQDLNAEVSLKFVQYFLASPYQYSSKISLARKNYILGFLTGNTLNNYILRLLNLSINIFIFVLITSYLVYKFTLASIVTIVSAGLMLIILNKFLKPILQDISVKLQKSSLLFNQRTNEALLNIKGVKISNNEVYFYANYKKALQENMKNSIHSTFFNSVPPYVIEPFIITLLCILLAIISLQTYSDPHRLIASFALIVSAVFRISPAISRIQVNLNGIHSAVPIVKEFLQVCDSFDLKNLPALEYKDFANFTQQIELKNINFEYVENTPVLKNISLTIKKGEFIGVAGLSGGGKTTLADIISGLLIPQSGEILIDGNITDKPLKIGYIPQDFTTISASIKDNITFGAKEINDEKVIETLKKAQLYDFVIEHFKDGINANPFIDSAGFSQGQKQRLAIARALYSDPDVLILDEATSSLDLKTEEEVCKVLQELKGEKTIIAIAHRLSTIKQTDRVIFIQNGTVADSGKFEELAQRNTDFKELVELASVS